MVEQVAASFKEVKRNYDRFVTHQIQWRKDQLAACKKGLEEMSDEFAEAIYKDFGRAKELSHVYEISPCIAECVWDIAHIDEMCADKMVETELMLGPGTTLIR